MTKPKITGQLSEAPGLFLWSVKYRGDQYFTYDWDDALRYALCLVKNAGPQRIPLPPEPPRDRVIEARTRNGEATL